MKLDAKALAKFHLHASSDTIFFVLDGRTADCVRFVVHADESFTAFMELESAMRQGGASRAAGEVKPVYGKNTKWLLFNPNQLQKFAQ